MSALLVVAAEVRTPPLPPAVWDRVAAFLASGASGDVVLHVKDGRVRQVKITESIPVPASLDEAPPMGHHSRT